MTGRDVREQIVRDLRAEYDRVASQEGATLESERIITAVCDGLLRAIRIAERAS